MDKPSSQHAILSPDRSHIGKEPALQSTERNLEGGGMEQATKPDVRRGGVFGEAAGGSSVANDNPSTYNGQNEHQIKNEDTQPRRLLTSWEQMGSLSGLSGSNTGNTYAWGSHNVPQPNHINRPAPQPTQAPNYGQSSLGTARPKPPNVRQPRFRNAFEAQQQHLLKASWRPDAGTFGMPLDDDGLMTSVCRLFNAFVDSSEVFDRAVRPDLVARFQPGGFWTRDLDDIEAISHILVSSVCYLHLFGTTGLQFKHDRLYLSKEDKRLTFRQRIWLLERMIKHYKVMADRMMRQCQIEDYVVYIWEVITKNTDFGLRMTASKGPAKDTMLAEFHSLGLPTEPVVQPSSVAVKRSMPDSSPANSAPKRRNVGTSPATPNAVASHIGTSNNPSALSLPLSFPNNLPQIAHLYGSAYSPAPESQAHVLSGVQRGEAQTGSRSHTESKPSLSKKAPMPHNVSQEQRSAETFASPQSTNKAGNEGDADDFWLS